jgi:hypothetical protein
MFYDDELTEEKDYLFKIPILGISVKTWQLIVFLVICAWMLILGLGAAVIWWAIMSPIFPQYGVVGNLNGDTNSINKHFTVYTTVINTVNNQTTEPDGFIAAEHSFGFAINHRDIDGPRRVQESPRITAMMKRINGTFWGDTALNFKLTCGSNATTYGNEVSKWNITCDTPAITANSSGLVVEGDLVVTGGINMPNSRIQFQGEDVLTHGLDPTTGLNVLQLGVGNKRTHYRATQHDFVGLVNTSSNIITPTLTATSGTITTLSSTSGTISTLSSTTGTITTLSSTTGTITTLTSTSASIPTISTTVINAGTNKIISVLNGQIQIGNDTTGSTFPSDFRGLPGQFLITNGLGVTSWADRGRVLKSQFTNPTPTVRTQSQSNLNEGIATFEVDGTTKLAGTVIYFGTTPGMTIRYDIRDLTNSGGGFAGVIVATTGDFTPSAGFNEVNFNSFPATGSGKSHVLLVILLYLSHS